ncbi:MAG: ABC transporter ATP-binding protein [Flavobacteriales bacterium]
MSGEAPLIRVEGLSKKFCTDLRTSLKYGVRDLASELFGSERDTQLRPKEFWALRDIGFELRRGECLGLLGRNGAGKTTLLKMLNGLMKPDAGRIELRGRIGALIALGAGFNPVLTGRENVFVNAAVLGIPRSTVRQRMAEIIDFAELDEFIDMPVQNYSSGMSVRLGFAVAAVLLEPDILFLDEVLAVGDIGFTMKCLNRVRELMARSAVIFVSHSMPMVSAFCTRALVMQRGQVMLDTTDMGEAINRYMQDFAMEHRVTGMGGAQVEAVSLVADGAAVEGVQPEVRQNAEAFVDLYVNVDTGTDPVHANVFIDDMAMSQVLAVPLKDEHGERLSLHSGRHRLRVPLGRLEMNMGTYSLLVSLNSSRTGQNICRAQGLRPFVIKADAVLWSKMVREGVTQVMPPH